MLERLLLRILDVYIGDYIESINREQLKLGVLKGKVVLRDLKLKAEALRGLGLPIVVKDGTVGELVLRIPWGKFNSESVSVSAKDVEIVVVPNWSDGGQETDHGRKLQRLEASEMMWQQLDEISRTESQQQPQPQQSRKPFRQKLLRRIFNNTRAQITNVTLRYLDDYRDIDIWMTIKEIFVGTVNSQMESTFFSPSPDEEVPLLMRQIRVQDFSLHCNDGTGSDTIMLRPFNAELRVLDTFTQSGSQLTGAARTMKLHIEPLYWHTTTGQFANVWTALESLALPKVRERPHSSPRDSPRLWWKFAINRIKVSLRHSRPRSFDLRRAINNRSEYIQLYCKKLDSTSSLSSLSSSTLDNLRQLEIELPIDTILLYRRFAIREAASAATTESDAKSPKKRKTSAKKWLKRSLKSFRSTKGKRKWLFPSVDQQQLYESVMDEMDVESTFMVLGNHRQSTENREADVQVLVYCSSVQLNVSMRSDLSLRLTLQNFATEMVSHKRDRYRKFVVALERVTLADSGGVTFVDIDVGDRSATFASTSSLAFARYESHSKAKKQQQSRPPSKLRLRRKSQKSSGGSFSLANIVEEVKPEGHSLFSFTVREGNTKYRFGCSVLRLAFDLVLLAQFVKFLSSRRVLNAAVVPSTKREQVTPSSLQFDIVIDRVDVVFPKLDSLHNGLEFVGSSVSLVSMNQSTATVSGLWKVTHLRGNEDNQVLLDNYNPDLSIVTEKGIFCIQGQLELPNILLRQESAIACISLGKLFRSFSAVLFKRKNRHSAAKHSSNNKKFLFDLQMQDQFKLEVEDLFAFSVRGVALGHDKFECSSLNLVDLGIKNVRLGQIVDIPQQFCVNISDGLIKIFGDECSLGWNHTLLQRLSDFSDRSTPVVSFETIVQQREMKAAKTAEVSIHIEHFNIEFREESLNRGLLSLGGSVDVTVHHNCARLSVDSLRMFSIMSATADPIPLVSSNATFALLKRGNEYKASFYNLHYTHFHNLFKEWVDYVEYGIKQPLAMLSSSSSSSSSTSTGDISLTLELQNSKFVVPSARNAEAYDAENHGVYKCEWKSNRIVSTSLSKGKQEFEIEILSGRVMSQIPPEYDRSVVSHFKSITGEWTREAFTPNEAKTRKLLYVKGLDGIRSWFNNPSGNGFRNSFRWNLFHEDRLLVSLSQEQFHLFNIIMSENATDWRSCTHTCQPMGWANCCGDLTLSKEESTCFCENLASEERVLELQVCYVFPKETCFDLSFSSNESVMKVHFINLTYGFSDYLRYGRNGSFDANRLWIDVVGKGRLVDSFGSSDLSLQLAKNKSRDQEFFIRIAKLTAVLDIGSFQQLLFFFNGNNNERERLNCPTSYGPDPVCNRRPKATKRHFVFPNLQLCLAYTDTEVIFGDVELTNIRSRDMQRVLNVQAKVWCKGTFKHVLTKPVSLSYDSNVLKPHQHSSIRRTSFTLDHVDVSVSQLKGRTLFKDISKWFKSIHRPGKSMLKSIKTKYYSLYQVSHVKTQAVFQFNGAKLRINDAQSRRDLPLFLSCSSSFIIREVSEVIAANGRKVSTFEGDFTSLRSPVIQHDEEVFTPTAVESSADVEELEEGISISYFNTRIERWEPLVEPWIWEWTVQRTSSLVLDEKSSIAIQLQAPRLLNINFSYALLKTLQWTLAVLKVFPTASPDQPERSNSKKVIINNLSGWEVTVIKNDDGISGDGVLLLKDGETATQTSSCLEVSLSWQLWHPLEGVSIAEIGSFIYTLYPRESANFDDDTGRTSMMTKVCVDVRPQEGGRVVQVRSMFEFRNHTNVDVDVLMIPSLDPVTQHQSSGVAISHGPVKPGISFLLPIHALHSSLSVKPSRGSVDWWEGVDLRQIEQDFTTKSMEVSCADEFIANLNIVSHVASNPQKAKRCFSIDLTPPVMIENLLPVCLHLKEGKNEEGCVELHSGSSHGLYTRPSDCVLSFKVSSSKWSEKFVFREVVPIDSVDTIEESVVLIDRNEKEVKVLLEMKRTSHFSWHVVVYTGAWLLNRTGLSLSYKSGNVHIMDAFEDTASGDASIADKKKPLKYKHGENVQVWSKRNERWGNAVIFQINAVRGSYDILFDDGWLALDVEESNVRDFSSMNDNEGQLEESEATDEETEEDEEEEEFESGATELDYFKKDCSENWEDHTNVKLDSVVMFSEGNHLALRIKLSGWSVPCNIESVGTKGTLLLPVRSEKAKQTRTYCEIAVHIGLAPLKYRRTKVVSFRPRYVFITNMKSINDVIMVAQSSSCTSGKPVESTVIKMRNSEVRPLFFMRNFGTASPDGVVCITFNDTSDWEWSCGFSVLHDINTAIKIKSKSSGVVRVVRVSVETKDATSYVSLSLDDGTIEPSLYKIINNSSNQLVHYFQDLSQVEVGSFQSDGKLTLENSTNLAFVSSNTYGLYEVKPGATSRGIVERIFPSESKPFGWDRLAVSKRILILSFSGDTKLFGCNLDELNQKTALRVSSDCVIWATTYYDGSTKVLKLFDDEESEIREKQEESVEMKTSAIVVQIALSGIGLSVIDSMPQEVMFVTLGGITFDFLQHPNADRSVELVVGWAQIDNQLANARVPIVLTTSIGVRNPGTPKAVSPGKPLTPATTFIHLSVVERNALQSMNCLFIEYAGLSIHEFEVTIEVAWVLYMWRLLQECARLPKVCYEHALFLSKSNVVSETKNDVAADESHSLEHWLEGVCIEKSSRGVFLSSDSTRKYKRIYIEWMEIHPIKASLSIQNLVEDPRDILNFDLYSSPGPLCEGKDKKKDDGIYTTNFDDKFDPTPILSVLPTTFSDVEGATIFINALVLKNALLTLNLLLLRIRRHIFSESISQLHRVIGSSEVLGNPIGLVTNLGSGLRDLFYEPAQGLVMGPEAFGAGLARGTKSFVHRTAFGTFDSISKISSSIGSGVAMLSMDPKYQSDRRLSIVDEKPRHLGDGLLLGAKSLGVGLGHGLSGIIMEPIRGAEQEGVEGFFKGVGIGILGVAVKPAVGVFDMVARFLAGIKSTVAMLDPSEKAVRRRLPRVLHTYQHYLKNYDPTAAFVQSLLLQTWGMEKSSSYVSHTPLPNHLLLVFSRHSLGCIDYSCYAPDVSSERTKPHLLWNLDTRMIVKYIIKVDNLKMMLVVQLSDPNCLTYAESREELSVSLLSPDEGGGCELRLYGNDVLLQSIKKTLDDVVVGPKHQRDFGCTLCPVPKTLRHRSNIRTIESAAGTKVGIGLVARIKGGSIGEKIGLKVGDYIVAVGGCSLGVEDYGEVLIEAVSDLPSDAILEIMIFREGRWINKKVQLSN